MCWELDPNLDFRGAVQEVRRHTALDPQFQAMPTLAKRFVLAIVPVIGLVACVPSARHIWRVTWFACERFWLRHFASNAAIRRYLWKNGIGGGR
jgi:hypothetical protein